MRVDHVGSLLRPEELKAAFRRRALGEVCGRTKTGRVEDEQWRKLEVMLDTARRGWE